MGIENSKIARSIPYYQLLEYLGESLNASIFKAFSKDNPDDIVTVKILKRQINHEAQRRYLRQRVERLKIIHDPRVIVPRSIEYFSEAHIIVNDYFPGITLDSYLMQNKSPLNLNTFFIIAAELTQAINNIHEAGIIHGNVKPHNILIQHETRSIRLIDFLNPIDIQELSHFIYDRSFVEGTLAYTSPEQTGRINHRVDYSTDIYSLGIVFYQLLTGKLPFASTDPLALIHSHLAEEALPISSLNAAVPGIVAQIIAKMCLKEPEKRYQTGSGLYADLHRCSEEYRQNGRIEPFTLGLRDHTRRVIFISKMVGRDREAKVILAQYTKVTGGKGFQSAFISGLPGIGKTRLIQELQQPLVAHKGYFTSGKFDQYQKNIPYSSLIQALRNLIRTLLTESDSRVDEWKQQIVSALNQHARVICNVIPELEVLIGSQPEVTELPPVEARHRFNNLFSAFLTCLARKENPLVLFIDDLQWCDSATFDFLSHLFTAADEHPHLFFIGAYRHNEVDTSHALVFLLRQIKEQHQAIQEIRIGALDAQACHEMVAYILDLPLPRTDHLAAFLTELTEGNPLFVSESLSWLHNEDLLVYSDQGQWIWDMARIRLSNMPTSVVDMFGFKVQRLEAQTLEVIKVCACMGNRFSADDVALICDMPLLDLFERLKPLLTLGLLIESKAEFQFVHDRVQEAVLRLIEPHQRQNIHWQVGWHLLSHQVISEALEAKENLFTVAAHLNLGYPKNIDEKQSLLLAQINLYAGNKALNALATQAANEYYRSGLAFLSKSAWQTQYPLMFRLHQKLAKTELMCGRYEQSEVLLNQLLKRAENDLDRAEALAEQTTSLSSIGNFIKAIDSANRGLGFFDKSIPEDDKEATERLNVLMQSIHRDYGDVWQKILNMPFVEDRQSKIELVFYSELIPDLYMSGLVPQLYLSAAQSTIHCLEGGMDESVIYSFSIMGLNLGEQGQFEMAFRYQDLAHELCTRYPDTFGATRGMNGIVWCNMHSRSHPNEIVDFCRKGIQCGKNCGDLYNAGLSYGPLMWNLQVLGADFALIEDTALECLEFSQKNQLSFSVGLAEAVMAGWVNPMKHPQATADTMSEQLALWESRNHVASAGSYYVLLGASHFYFGRYQEALTCLDSVKRFLNGMTDNVLKRQWYAFQILNALCVAPVNAGKELHDELTPFLDQLKTWAALGPLLKPYLALCEAEWQRVFDHSPTITNGYLDAIESARALNYVFLDGFINERFAEWLIAQKRVSADSYLEFALKQYQQCGAKGKVIQLLERHPQLFRSNSPISNEEAVVLEETSLLPNLDTDYLLKSSLALSAEIDQKALLAKIMQVVLECSGAQQGYLLQAQAKQWQCVAARHIEKKATDAFTREFLTDINDICQGIVHYVIHTRTSVVLDNAMESQQFSNLPEVMELHIRSLFCLPVLRQGELIAVLYLENRLATRVFTPDKVRMVELLSLQMAISIENARLINEIGQLNAELERRVTEETRKSRKKDHLLIQQSKLATMGEMINNIAHQWRQPLNALSLMLGNIQDAQRFDDLSTDFLEEQLQHGMRYIEKMSSTIDDFRDFFSPNKPREAFSLRHAVKDAIALVEASFKAHSVNIELNIENDVQLHGILNEYSQVLLNLLTNAKEAILSLHSTGTIRVSVVLENNQCRLLVKDNGGGIPENSLPHIFEPYYSTKEGGMGIGLYMSRMITETSLNGQIEVVNDGDGAIFTIITPILSVNSN
ncbi:AAA family ATPase [Methylotuvimicrobium buryatense]|uniref:histidine kinase n=1 Tax=Methylotuvimicrobium buryatense TaxID=95641 RepID=A0A4P9UMT9_METBY|nr:AAA family ATPase [Methylotuvimicrobium buryatense]QCW82662.1 GAF domain-containing protein [Methylotuvimicrobium buryatense]